MPERRAAEQSQFKILLAFASVYLFWGCTYLAIRVAVETIPPFYVGGIRFLIAGAVLYAAMRLRGEAPPARLHWRDATIVGGLLLLGGNGSLAWSEQRVPSGLAALLAATIPIWMVLLDSFRKSGPKLEGRVLMGLAVGLAGLGLLVGPAELLGGSRVDPAGAGVLMFAALSWSVGSLYARHAKLPPSPFLAAAMEMLAGGALLVILGTLTGEASSFRATAPSVRSITALVYLVVFGSWLGFTGYIWLLRVVSTTRVATYAYVNPIVAVFFGWLIAGEALTARTLVATITIVAAVALIITHRPTPAAVAPDAEGLPTSEEKAALGVIENRAPAAE